MAQAVTLRAAGVHTNANRLGDETPEGALARAQNCVIDREGLIEPRRGLKAYAAAFSAGTAVRRLLSFAGTRLAHVASTLYKDNGSGTFSSFSGTFAEPASGFRLRDAVAGGSLFFTSAVGVQELDAVANNPQTAGYPSPLDSTATLSGSAGFLADDAAVAYRAVLYRVNANDKEIVSAPSQRLIAINEAGGERNVAIRWYLPAGVSTSIFYRVYRSEQTATPDANPSDEMQLVREARLTATDVANGYIDVTDSQPDDLRGAALYTNPSQEGIEQANDQPPYALDLCEFRGFLIYANVRNRQRYLTELIGVGDSLTIFSAGVRFRTFSGTTTNGSPLVTGAVGEILFLRVGMKMKAAAGIPATARIQSLALVAGPLTEVTMTVNATATGARSVEAQDVVGIAGLEYFAASAEVSGSREFLAATAGTPAENIEATSRSIVRVVNADASSTVYAFYDSDGETTQRGLLRFQERAIGGAAFAFFCTAIDAFSPSPPSSGATELSTNDADPTAIMISKQDQHGAVPLANRLKRGSSAIQRCIATRDAVYLLSDQVHRMSGTGLDNFDIATFDTTIKLIGPETAVVLADAIYCMSTQGVVRISESGVEIVSRAIEVDLIRGSKFASYADRAFAVARESERAYLLWVPETSSDTVPTIAWRYNLFTNAWSGPLRKEATCGLNDPVDDKLYLGDKTLSIVRQERKALDRTDFADEEFAVTIATAIGTLVVVNTTAGLVDGDLLVQGALESIVEDVVNGTTLQVRDTLAWSAAAATVYRGYPCTVEWLPITFGDPSVVKQHSEAAVLFRAVDFERFDIAFASNYLPTVESKTLRSVALDDEDGVAPWGDLPNGSEIDQEQPIRTYVPYKRQMGNWLRVACRFTEPRGYFSLAGLAITFEAMTTKFYGNRQT